MAKEEKEHDEMKQTVEDEVKETSKEQAGEAEIPEEFQKQASTIVESCHNRMQLSYIRDLCYRKEEEIRKAEEKKDTKGKNKVPNEYSLKEAPSSL